MTKKLKFGLVSRLIIAIILGILLGKVLPEPIIRVVLTFSSLFSKYLSFIIPLMIIGFVVSGIADLTQGAGKLLSITTLISYISTIIGGFLSYTMAVSIFPQLIDLKSLTTVLNSESLELTPFFTIPLTPVIDVTSAIIFAFIMGLSISWLKTNGKGEITYNLFAEFSQIITKVLSTTMYSIITILYFWFICKYVL